MPAGWPAFDYHPGGMIAMKKVISLILLSVMLCCMIPFSAFAEEEEATDVYTQSNGLALSMRPGETWDPGREGVLWMTDAPEVVSVRTGVFAAQDVGFATVLGADAEGNLYQYDITVESDGVPALMRAAIDYALNEWQQVGGERLPRCNKYTLWYSNGNKYEYGWCAAFECYCLYHVGIPMVEWTKCEPHPDGDVWGVKANGVGKVIEGYNKMNRLTFVPRTGYLVVYGQKDSGNSMHVGIITDVQDLGNGQYLVKTVEGNMSNTVKRYCYLYTVGNADESRANGKNNYNYGVYGNYSDCPEEYRTEPETYQYTIHSQKWYVFRFCATWF